MHHQQCPRKIFVPRDEHASKEEVGSHDPGQFARQ